MKANYLSSWTPINLMSCDSRSISSLAGFVLESLDYYHYCFCGCFIPRPSSPVKTYDLGLILVTIEKKLNINSIYRSKIKLKALDAISTQTSYRIRTLVLNILGLI